MNHRVDLVVQEIRAQAMSFYRGLSKLEKIK